MSTGYANLATGFIATAGSLKLSTGCAVACVWLSNWLDQTLATGSCDWLSTQRASAELQGQNDVVSTVGDPDPPPGEAAEEHKTGARRRSIRKQQFIIVIHRAFKRVTSLELVPGSNRYYNNPALLGRLRQSGPRPDPRLLRQAALEALTRSARTDSPRRIGRKQFFRRRRRRRRRRVEAAAAAI
ncbi:hypothetical protein F511_20438 [Dorcoceras hygrometricum]|uniref:Uncharacterized protein n=1 Tax=Dorcoceras hygrometricum TaxID=472368 RepID=A0A2Z7AKM0_9LAMI|nr:hypothetical protein F511_20438 [Dorcoceras hygrometricum]